MWPRVEHLAGMRDEEVSSSPGFSAIADALCQVKETSLRPARAVLPQGISLPAWTNSQNPNRWRVSLPLYQYLQKHPILPTYLRRTFHKGSLESNILEFLVTRGMCSITDLPCSISYRSSYIEWMNIYIYSWIYSMNMYRYRYGYGRMDG